MGAAGLAADANAVSGLAGEPWQPSFNFGLHFTSDFFHRGFLHQDGGTITQSFFSVSTRWHAADSCALSPYVSAWNSTLWSSDESMDSPVAGHGSPRDDSSLWELKGGIVVGNPGAPGLNGDFSFMHYAFPDGAFADVSEIGARINYRLLLGEDALENQYALKTFAGLFAETNKDHRAYFEMGTEPSVLLRQGSWRLGVGVPMIAGLSGDGYYEDENGESTAFGFISAGVAMTASPDLPDGWGQWFFSASLEYLRLVADNLRLLNFGDSQAVIVRAGLGIAF